MVLILRGFGHPPLSEKKFEIPRLHQNKITNYLHNYKKSKNLRNFKSKLGFFSFHFYHTSPEGKEDEI